MSKKTSIVLQIIFFLAFVLLLAAIIYGVTARDISAEGSIMLDIYWGQFTFIDIYIAFIVFYLWIVFREKSVSRSLIWFVLVMTGGSMTICLYLFIVVRNCDRNWGKLIAGDRMEVLNNG